MPLEPVFKVLVALANRQSAGRVPMPLARMAEDRANLFMRAVVRKGAPVQAITNHMVPVDGGEILVRIYRPQPGTLPLHVFFHGGGFCTGNAVARDDRCKDMAVQAGCVVASVDYRLAPENRYPTGPEDCYAALCWLVDHAADSGIGIDPTIISVSGESAGGTLAAVMCLMARDRGGPPICFQLLEVPATDLTLSQPSIRALGQGYMLTIEGMEDFMRCYLGDPAQAMEPYASPLHAADVRGLPPALIMTCEFDPLRDDGRAYADKLEAAGVPVRYVQLDGHFHGSFALNRVSASARTYLAEAASALRAAHAEARRAVSATGAGAGAG